MSKRGKLLAVAIVAATLAAALPGCLGGAAPSAEPTDCPTECVCLTEAEAASLDLELCQGKKILCGYDDTGAEKYCYQEPVAGQVEETDCPTGCICLTEPQVELLNLALCEGRQIICGYDPAGYIKYCYEKPPEEVACPAGCVCLTEDDAESLGLDLCLGQRILCGHDALGRPRYCYEPPIVPPPVIPLPEPTPTPTATAGALSGRIAGIDPSQPTSLAPLLGAKQDLDGARAGGTVSEGEAEDVGEELEDKFGQWIREMVGGIDSLKGFYDLQAVQALEDYLGLTDPVTRAYKEQAMAERFNEWVRDRMNAIDPSDADSLGEFFWMQSLQTSDKYDHLVTPDTHDWKEEQMGEKFNEYIRNRMNEIDPTDADSLKYFFWMQNLQTTDKYDEYATTATHDWKEEQMGAKFNDWVKNRVDDLDPDDPDFIDDLRKLRAMQQTEKYSKYVTAATHAYKEQQIKIKFGQWVTDIVNNFDPAAADASAYLAKTQAMQYWDWYDELCPEEVKRAKALMLASALNKGQEPIDPPQVAVTSPEDGESDVSINQPIVVAFDQPMETDSVEASLEVTPPAVYDASWMDEGFVLTLEPVIPWQYNTEYSVKLGAGAMSIYGIAMEESHGLYFITQPPGQPPQVTGTNPVHGQLDAHSGTPIEIDFDQPMDAESLAAAIDTSPEIDHELVMLDDDTRAMLQPLQPLDFNTVYTVAVGSSAASAEGIPMTQSRGFAFITGVEDPPAVMGTLPFDGQTDIPSNHPIEIAFDRPMNTDSMEASLTVTPTLDYTAAWREADFVLTIEPTAPPAGAASYTFTLETGAMSAVGLPLETDFSFSFTTR